MSSNFLGLPKYVTYILFFPQFYIPSLWNFAWGAADPFWIMMAKRLLILWPVCGIIAASWISVLSIISIVFRFERRKFVEKFILTWWDLGRAIFFYWWGLAQLSFVVVMYVLGLVQMIIMGILILLQDILLTPFRMLRSVGESTMQAGTPWLAAFLTFAWCLVEAGIFTYVMTPLVMDVFTNMTGEQLTEFGIRIPLFIMLLGFILGSYAVLHLWVEAFKTRDIPTIVKISVFEICVMGFEVMFMYREFVDALMPWFAQHAGSDLEPGIFGILFVAGFTWMGSRAMSWFLFASAGAPTILAIIQRTGLQSKAPGTPLKAPKLELSTTMIAQVRKELGWVKEKGEEFLGALCLPPLQILSAIVNFCTLLMFSRHTFDMPLQKMAELVETKNLFERVDQQGTGI